MKLSNRTIVSLVVLVGLASMAMAAAPTITVIPSFAPNYFGSPSWGTYASNGMNALESSLAASGDSSSPAYYQAAPASITVSQNICTGFNSWNGNADPATAFGPAYAGELGNRLHFGVVVNGNGTKVSLSEVGFSLVDTNTATATDPDGHNLDYSWGPGADGLTAYSSLRVGIIHGDSGDTFITSGSADQLVDELVYIGSGNSWAVYNDADFTGDTLQSKIDNEAAKIFANGPFTLTGTYYLDSPTGPSGSAVVSVVPEPASLSLLAIGGMALLRRKNR